jgi:hypothetical protein
MRRVVAALLASIALAACASNTDPSGSIAACNSISSEICTREYACDTSLAGTVASCVNDAQTQTCATFTCTTGTSVNSSQVSQCISDITSQSCTDVNAGTAPLSCNTICQ